MAVMMYAVLFYEGAERWYRLWYYTPAALLFGSLLLDRVKARSVQKRGFFLDGMIAAICFCRPVFGWPAISGHALFFVYAFFTAGSCRTRVFALIVGGITLYAKIWLWHWDVTLWPGLVLGLLAGVLYRRGQEVSGVK